MKPFLGISLDKDPKNEILNGEEFVTERISGETLENLRRSESEWHECLKKAKLPLAIRVVSYVFAALTVIILICLVRAISEIEEMHSISLSISEAVKIAYTNAPHFLWAALGFALFFIAVTAVSIVRKKKILSSEEARGALIRLNLATEAALSDMSVLENAPRVDVLSFSYKTKEDGKIIPKLDFHTGSPYFAIELFAFKNNESLVLADSEQRYEFPLSEIEGIERINKDILIPNRGMEIINEYHKKLTDFKMSTDDNGALHVKPYYVMTVNRLGEKYGIYFPCYSLPLFEELTGMRAGKENGDTIEAEAAEDEFSKDFN